MNKQVKIVLLGATSMSFGLSVLRDIFSSNELRGCTLTLVGRHPDTLAKSFNLAQIQTPNVLPVCTSSRRPIAGPPSTAPVSLSMQRRLIETGYGSWISKCLASTAFVIRWERMGDLEGCSLRFAPCRWCSISCARCRNSVQRVVHQLFQSGKPHHPGARKI